MTSTQTSRKERGSLPSATSGPLATVGGLSSSQEPVYQPQHQAEHDAENDAGGDGEKDRCVLSTVADVPGQASEWHIGASGEQDDEANQDEQSSSANQQLANGVHDLILTSPTD